MKLMPCICPSCGVDLDGLSMDRVLCCSKCHIAIEFYEDEIKEYPFSWIKPAFEKDNPLIYLPFWMFNVAVSINHLDQDKNVPILLPRRIFIPGFRLHGYIMYGNPSLNLSSRAFEFRECFREQPLVGCRYRRDEAVEMVDITVKAVIDRQMDIGSLQISIEILEEKLVAFPYFDEGEKLTDGVLNTKLVSIAVDNLSEIRRFHRD